MTNSQPESNSNDRPLAQVESQPRVPSGSPDPLPWLIRRMRQRTQDAIERRPDGSESSPQDHTTPVKPR